MAANTRNNYAIIPAIQAWCHERHVSVPSVRKGWGYRGQTFAEWLVPVPRCQLELLPTAADFASCPVTALFFVCDPLGVGDGNTCYRVHAICNVAQHMDELFDTLSLFFPHTQKQQQKQHAFKFCTLIAKVFEFECAARAATQRHAIFNMFMSVYRDQYDLALAEALNGHGFTDVTFSKAGALCIPWEHPNSPLEQKLFDMFKGPS